MSEKYKYQPKNFQPIPTPEEEAMEDHRVEGNRHGNRALLVLLIAAGTSFFHNEIGDAGLAIWRLFT